MPVHNGIGRTKYYEVFIIVDIKPVCVQNLDRLLKIVTDADNRVAHVTKGFYR